MGAGFGKQQGKNPDGFEPMSGGAYQMVPLKGSRTIIVSSDHRAWTLSPSSKWTGEVKATTTDGRVMLGSWGRMDIPANTSAAIDFEGTKAGPAYFSLETDGAPGERQTLMLSVLPTRKRDIAASIIKSDMLRTNPMSRGHIMNLLVISTRFYSEQSNVDLIDSQGYIDDWEYPLEDLGNPIIITPWFLLGVKAKVGIFKRRVHMIYGWNFEAWSRKEDEEITGQTFANVNTAFIETDRNFRDVAGTTVHELGHAFGLGHEENDPTNIMYPFADPRRLRFNAHQIEALNGYNSSFPS